MVPANLTHFNLQSGVGGRDEQHEITRQHVITRSGPTRWLLSAGTGGFRRAFLTHDLHRQYNGTLFDYQQYRHLGWEGKPLMYFSCPKELF